MNSINIKVPAWSNVSKVTVHGETHTEIHLMEAWDDMVYEDELVEVVDGYVELKCNGQFRRIIHDLDTDIITVIVSDCK